MNGVQPEWIAHGSKALNGSEPKHATAKISGERSSAMDCVSSFPYPPDNRHALIAGRLQKFVRTGAGQETRTQDIPFVLAATIADTGPLDAAKK